jgi:HAD superfamily hydrolase (TIGR01484 family)
MRNFKIAFFDIDGTLADNRLIQQSKVFDRIPKSAKETLKQLKRHTIEPVIASGRNFETIRPLAEALGVESVVSSNGQYVTYKGEEVYKKTLPEDTVKALIEELREKGQEFLMEAAHHVYQFDGEKFKGDGT